MAKFVLRDARVYMDALDASSQTYGVNVERTRNALEITGYGQRWKEYTPGATITELGVSMFADATLGPALLAAYNARRTVYVTVLPTVRGAPSGGTTLYPAASVFPASSLYPGTTGGGSTIQVPQWSANCVIAALTPLKADAGDAAQADVQLRSTGPVFEYYDPETLISPMTLLGTSTLVGP